MIYPAFQKTNISEWVDFIPGKIIYSGYECDRLNRREADVMKGSCKDDILYIDVVKENSRRTEYIEETRRITDEKYFFDAEKCDDGIHITVTVSGEKSLFRATNRIWQLKMGKKFFIGTVEDYPLFAQRGYIEGFYGTPWDSEQRENMIDLLSLFGMNTHYYAPKDDPYHRDKWDELYPEKELSHLSHLLEECTRRFMDFYFCIAPGLSMKYSSEEDFLKLTRKAEQLYNIGVRNFGLLLDDIPDNLYFDEDKAAFDSEAVNAHIHISNKFFDYLRQLNPECRLTVCPLQYHGNGDEYYISKLGKGLDGSIRIFWTGHNICSQELTVREAVIFENSTNRKPLYWDNFPVNDAEMQNEMHFGYINGRDPDLYRYCEGIISNAMEYSLSSRIPLFTVCDYLWNPIAYDGYSSWKKACELQFGKKAEIFMPFFDNLLTSCLKVENSPMMNIALNDAQQKLFSGDKEGAKAIVKDYIIDLQKCLGEIDNILENSRKYLPSDEYLIFKELAPWVKKQKIACALLIAVRVLFDDNSDGNKNVVRVFIKKYLDHPKTLCDFSLQAFAERMLTL